MAIPKTRKPLADQNRIKKAIEMAGGEKPKESAGLENKTESPKAELKNKKRIGRPPLAGDRSNKITFFTTKETHNRFNLAFPQEQYKRAKRGEKVDKSLILEESLRSWLDQNGY